MPDSTAPIEAGERAIRATWRSSLSATLLIESAIVKYDYDPRKAMQLLAGLGYTKGSDGFLADGSGQRQRDYRSV